MAAGDVRHFSGSRNEADGAATLASAGILNLAGTANIRIKVNSGTLRVGQAGVVSATSGLTLTPQSSQGMQPGVLDMPAVVAGNMSVFAQGNNVFFEVLASYTA